MTKKPKVLLIYTGGTIGMHQDKNGQLVPFDFSTIKDEFPSLRNIDVELGVYKMRPIDSSNANTKLWKQIATAIKSKYSLYDGFVVLHGTDTMAYSASALSFMLDNLEKPVIFTGSQIPLGVMRTDGRENLITAIEIAAAKEKGRAIVPEVCLYFQNKLFRGNRSTKLSSESLAAFDSRNYPVLAEVGVNIHYNRSAIRYPGRWGRLNKVEEPAELVVKPDMDENVVIVKLFPGISPTTLESVLMIKNLKGVVLESFGAGNAPTAKWFLDVVKKAISRGVTILNITQCGGGGVAMEIYQTGMELQKKGVFSGQDMTTEAAVTKLMWIFGQKMSEEEKLSALTSSLKGECSD